ncbi:MAG: ABC transporter permease [Actinomyces ruminicola]|uniref:Nucleoside ABC transporter membrane protein n=1 Tax=Actinomyces ruminicola TaxID=332524 RepID=A0A1H0BNQ2_9ACTO|nr:ABC transporter permease [Actinomyces ruminicola]MBE6480777.1 ABC transporter permease [Actinomyces ruminicola]SDN12105.1 simple sugar transport system permease protein [Actinomyces ruminicola]SDN47143.1 nucleoside ABC transporter membrane protein [Actinomyces ruminicola]
MTSSPTATQTRDASPEPGQLAVVEPIAYKLPVTGAVVVILEVLMGLASHGDTRFQLATKADFLKIPVLTLGARPVIAVMVLAAVALTSYMWVRAIGRAQIATWVGLALGASFIISFLTWAGAGRPTVIPLVTILSSTLALSVPLVFGGLAGVVGERSGTINIAIEGQLLGGAFLGAVVASITRTPWAGLIAAPLAGILVALLLAMFGLKYRVNQIVVGVVLNVFVSGLTSFLFSTVLTDNPARLNTSMRLPTLPIPVLSQIPIIGPVLFRQTILVYLMYAAVAVLSFMLFRSRWGLRMRACGEHPRAADTVGINVMRTRVNNLMLGGALAGLGGAFFTIGSGLAFTKDMSAGNGYIALAAMILGAWNPIGTLYAALLFGFATSVGQTLSVIGSPIPANIILMIPYIVTVFAVAGFVGRVRAPAAEGVPYP